MPPQARTRYELDGTQRVEALLARVFDPGRGEGLGEVDGKAEDAGTGRGLEQLWGGGAC